MKPKTLLLLAVAGSCGLFAMLGVQQAMRGKGGPVTETARVLVALENIDAGMKLTPDNVTFRSMPVDSLPSDPVRKTEDYEMRAARVPLLAGDIVRASKLTGKGEFGKSVSIPKGMRVISISVNDTHTNSGLVMPGDRVDVLVTLQSRGARNAPISKTKTLLEYVQVFAIDDATATKVEDRKDAIKAKNVSLLLTPEQVNYVLLAQQKGTLSLSWRNRGDDELAQTKEIDEKLLQELEGTVGFNDQIPLYDQFGEETVEAAPPAEPASATSAFLDDVSAEPTTLVQLHSNEMWTVQVYQGNEPVAHQFEIIEESKTGSANPLSGMLRSFWGGSSKSN